MLRLLLNFDFGAAAAHQRESSTVPRLRAVGFAAFLTVLVAACSSGSGASSSPSPTPTPSPSPTEQPTTAGGGPTFTAGAVGDLERILPDQVGGVTIKKESAKGTDFLKSSTANSKEVADFFTKIGANPADVTVATGIGQSTDVAKIVFIFAFRAPGSDETRLLDAFQQTTATGSSPVTWTAANVGGKSIRKATGGTATSGQYLYAKGDILFLISASETALADEVLSKLP